MLKNDIIIYIYIYVELCDSEYSKKVFVTYGTSVRDLERLFVTTYGTSVRHKRVKVSLTHWLCICNPTI